MSMAKRFLLLFLVALMWAIAAPSFATLSTPVPRPQTSSPLVNVATLEQQSRRLYEAGAVEQALELLQQAIAAYQGQGEDLRRAIALSNLALLYQGMGAWLEANEAIQTSLDLLSVPTDAQALSAQAQALDIQGRLQLAQGQTERALASWRQAAQHYQRLNDTERLVRNQIDQSRALQRLGLYRRAAALLRELHQTLQAQPDSLVKVAGLRSLGDALRVTGEDLEDSRQRLQASLEAAQRLQRSQGASPAVTEALALAELSLGNTAQAQAAAQLNLGDADRAQAFTRASLTHYQLAESGSLSTQIQARLNRLKVLASAQHWAAAQALWPQIQQQLEGLPLSQVSVYGRINLAHTLMESSTALGPEAEAIAAQLLSTAERRAQQLNDGRGRAYALGLQGQLYEQAQQWALAKDFTQQALWSIENSTATADIAYLWQWQLGRILKAQAAHAIEPELNHKAAIAAYKTALNTLQTLRRDLIAINPDEQFLFRESVEPAYRQFIELLLEPPNSAAANQTDLATARSTLESLQAIELENFFQQACMDIPVEIDRVVEQANEIAADPANAQAAILYPVILPERLEVILKLPNQANLRHYSTPVPEATVKAALTQLRQQLTQPETEASVQTLSEQVYRWLIRPVEDDLKTHHIRTLVFVLDGSLKNIPMAALYDGERYLVETYLIALTPGLSLPEPQPFDHSRISLLFAGLSEGVDLFEPLPAVEAEKAGILSEVSNSVVLLNKDFTAAAFQAQIEEKPFKIVHLATHGEFSSDPARTFIQASDRPINLEQLNGILRTREQTHSDPIELLVLSACQTAEGDERAALGLAGVAVRAGARSTLASLWTLDDETSAYTMIEFYRQLMDRPGLSKAVALQNAQLRVLNSPGHRHPSFWAPFVLLGNWL